MSPRPTAMVKRTTAPFSKRRWRRKPTAKPCGERRPVMWCGFKRRRTSTRTRASRCTPSASDPRIGATTTGRLRPRGSETGAVIRSTLREVFAVFDIRALSPGRPSRQCVRCPWSRHCARHATAVRVEESSAVRHDAHHCIRIGCYTPLLAVARSSFAGRRGGLVSKHGRGGRGLGSFR